MQSAPAPHPIRHVAIVGAGFSGTLQAINLLRHDGPAATLIERREQPARGLAYSAAHPHHLLNVQAAKMSAFPDDEAHFAKWLTKVGIANAGTTFVPRLTYGTYLSTFLAEAAERGEGRLQVRRGDVVDLDLEDGKAVLRLDDGERIEADAVVLAPGNLPPHNPPELAEVDLPADLYARDPWASGVTDGLGEDDTVLLLGTGLTMVDVALLLEAEGFRGRIVAMSRRGLAPRAHADFTPSILNERPTTRASGLVRAARERSEEVGWRAAVDELRPYTQSLWRAASMEEQGRFLRHLRPWWDVHRHRIAPDVAERIDRMRRSGQLEIVAGKLISVRERGGRVEVQWRSRGSAHAQSTNVRRIVNCTGPQGDLLRTTEPLLQNLLAKGLIRPDSHRLGLDVTAQAQVIGADGEPVPTLFALGPMTRGAFWEIVAVPDIRSQTWTVARYLSNAYWVEGEGL